MLLNESRYPWLVSVAKLGKSCGVWLSAGPRNNFGSPSPQRGEGSLTADEHSSLTRRDLARFATETSHMVHRLKLG